ncbi:hypothetical protein HPB50_002892 [Hyalomma asiaticum]|uniref:Uncharacterized protein n=1 Tax=Hyalomma asiaticum TaxID=266040 RepID=A0ACB7TBR5_HYAAI|nr:hypothetical protein HPB50_002892 [Hyalomma asiaticum]
MRFATLLGVKNCDTITLVETYNGPVPRGYTRCRSLSCARTKQRSASSFGSVTLRSVVARVKRLVRLQALPGETLEFQGRHLAHAPVGERSEKHERNGTCTFRGDPYAVDKFIEKAAVECYMYTNGLREEYQKKVCYKVGFPKICLNCTTDTRPPNEADCHLPDINNENSPLFLAFRTKAIGRLWANCVREAIACCQYMLDTPQRTDGVYCNRTWDGLTCYEDTDANRNVTKVCPRVLYIYSKPHCEYYSTRWCHENGSWYRLMNVQRTFYTSCAPKPWQRSATMTAHASYPALPLQEYVGVYHYSIGLFTLSVLSLIPALFIFNWYKSLQVPRILIHKHLCFAVMMCGVMYIIDHSVFTLDDVKPTKYTKNLTHSNTWWCKLLSVLNRYFMVSQYTWMLCEGYYLHRLVAQAFSKQMNLKFCYTFGWGILRFPNILLPQWRDPEPGETFVQPLQERPQHKQEPSAKCAADHHYNDDCNNSHVTHPIARTDATSEWLCGSSRVYP